jgi:hypothetical protein
MKLSGFLAVLSTMVPGLSLDLTAQRFETLQTHFQCGSVWWRFTLR